VATVFDPASPNYDWLNRIVTTGLGKRTRTQVSDRVRSAAQNSSSVTGLARFGDLSGLTDLSVTDLVVRLGGIEPPTLGLEVLGLFEAFCK
jgi:hypothetical protein